MIWLIRVFLGSIVTILYMMLILLGILGIAAVIYAAT